MSDHAPATALKWYFTAETNAEGCTYIKTYRTGRDKVQKKSRRIVRRHVGRLLEDDRIVISEKFSVDHSEYAEGEWYWGADKKPVTRAEYLDQFPPWPQGGILAVEKEEGEEDDNALMSTLRIGAKRAAWQFAVKNGIYVHL